MVSTTTDISFVTSEMNSVTYTIDISNSIEAFETDCSINTFDISFVDGLEIITKTGKKTSKTSKMSSKVNYNFPQAKDVIIKLCFYQSNAV